MRVQTIEYQCPHCGKKLSSLPQGKIVAMGTKKCYGQAIVKCKKYKKAYRQPFVEEAALNLTRKMTVPAMLYSPRVLNTALILSIPFVVIGALGMMASVFDENLQDQMGLILATLIAMAVMAAICAGILYILGSLTRSHRQKQKDTILKESQQRLLNDDTYFMILLAGGRSREELLALTARLPEFRAEMKRCFDADILPFHKNS